MPSEHYAESGCRGVWLEKVRLIDDLDDLDDLDQRARRRSGLEVPYGRRQFSSSLLEAFPEGFGLGVRPAVEERQ